MSTAIETDKKAALATAANEARGLAMDSIAAAHSGHMGLPLGAAEIGAVLYGSQVRFLGFLSHFLYRGNEPDCHTNSVYNLRRHTRHVP
jgi:hypothetical protein